MLLVGTLFTAIALTLLLLTYDIIIVGGLRLRTYIALFIIAYILLAQRALQYGHKYLASWMVVLLYASAALATLLLWGVNAPVGILAISLVIVLTGLLLGSRYVPYLTAIMIGALILIQFAHSSGVIVPDTSAIRIESSYWDVAGYAFMFFAYSLIAWASMKRSETILSRARKAEEAVRAQNEQMSIELDRQASILRQEQLTQSRQLYKFAIIGQSAAALLHELSSRLSVINFDLDDLKQQLKNSKAITNAEESVAYINDMVHQARQQLNSYGAHEKLPVRKLISTVVKDVKLKPAHRAVTITQAYQTKMTAKLFGDPLALSQILTILITNACEASLSSPTPHVTVATKQNGKSITISVSDNGPGINHERLKELFKPLVSSKLKGMGVGLYIAKHLTEMSFRGTLSYTRTGETTQFSLVLPSMKKEE